MKTYNIIILAVVIASMLSLGCTGGSNSQATPEDTFDEYVSYYNGMQGDKIYDLLSASEKGRTSKDRTYNLVLMYRETFSIYDYEIVDTEFSGNKATLNVDITWEVTELQIHNTNNYKVDFILEDEGWKMDSDIITY